MSSFERPENRTENRTTEVSRTDSYSWRRRGSDTFGEYIAYQGEGKIFFVYRDGKIAVADDLFKEKKIVNPHTAEGQKDMEAALALRVRDSHIHAARRLRASELAAGDPLLERVLTEAVGMSDGQDPQSRLIDGVYMYAVGENATHRALLGVKDGRLYLFSEGEEIYILPPNPADTPIDDDALVAEATQAIAFAWSLELENLSDMPSNQELERHRKLCIEQNVSKIREMLAPRLRAFKQSRTVKPVDNAVDIELHDGSIMRIYMKQMLEDVTDEKEVYIGRGDYFGVQPEETDAAPPDKRELN